MTTTTRELVEQWEMQTAYISSTTDIMAHPLALQVEARGVDAVDTIATMLDEGNVLLGVGPLTMLHRLTGAQPVKPRDYGRVAAMCRDWRKYLAANPGLRGRLETPKT